ncbi:MAG: sigma-70 family RNA polymerase sigma factor [Thiogranum sp.]|nr:sigma-70 family RNA polymerase sigma factor [Thiogranum sp.]
MCDSALMESGLLKRFDAEVQARAPVSLHKTLNHFLAEAQHKAYHVAYGALWDRETALDVVQESMLRLVEYYHGKPAEEWPALFRSVLNSRINDERRKRMLAQTKRKLLSLTMLGLTSAGPDEETAEADLPGKRHDGGYSDPEANVAGGELKQHIEGALGTLSDRQRQVFLLREQLGLSIRETAETLGCSENSIKQHHFRALQAMRGLLSEVWDHEHA